MLSSLFKYAATRVAGEAVDGLARRALWGGVAALFMTTSFVLGLMIAFWIFEPQYGAVPTAIAIAGVCVTLALISMAVPVFIDWRKRRAAVAAKASVSEPSVVVQASNALQDETEAAVDYFGAIQVIASAFVFGLGAARQIRGR
jgi:hypothetical protein